MNSMDDGLKIKHASGIIARDMIYKHMQCFAPVIRADRLASKDTAAAFIDGLAGTMALTIAGGHGSKDDVVNATIAKLREAVDRDLTHLGRRTK